jgi:hypothetical protein
MMMMRWWWWWSPWLFQSTFLFSNVTSLWLELPSSQVGDSPASSPRGRRRSLLSAPEAEIAVPGVVRGHRNNEKVPKSLATKGGSRSRYIDMTWCHCWFWWYEEDNIIYVNVYSILYWYERDLKMTWNDVSTGEVDAGPTPTRWFPEFLRFFVGSQLASRLDYWIYDDYNYSCLFVYWCL